MYVCMFLYMSVSLQECNYALPYVSISCCLPKLPQYAAVACWSLLLSDNSVTASHEPTSRAPSSGFSIVPMMEHAVRSHELPLERFASTTAIASYGSLRISVVWSRNHRFVTYIEQQTLPLTHMTVAS